MPDPAAHPGESRQAPQRLVLGDQQGGVDAPVDQAELTAWSDVIAALSPQARAELTGSLNLALAPCEPCWSRQEHLARCALEAPTGCENLDALISRAARVAAAGGGQGALRASITYGDVWLPTDSGEGRGWPDPDSPVVVELWVDPSHGLWREAASTAAELVARSAERSDMGALSITLRLFPTWQWRDQAAPSGAEDLHRALAAADRLGHGIPLLAALAAQEGDVLSLSEALETLPALHGPAWDDALASADADLADDAADARAIGLRVAPSWRIDGYRLRGPRSLNSLLDIAENQWLDHHDSLPAALLAVDRGAAEAAP